MSDYKQTRDAAGKVTTQYDKMLKNLDDVVDKLLCKGCDTPLSDCGPVGFACLNKSCSYEKELARSWLRKQKEHEEISELERLKAKYEG